MTIRITINGRSSRLEHTTTVTELLDKLGLSGRLAVEINHQIIPKKDFSKHNIAAGDKIEIVKAVGGG